MKHITTKHKWKFFILLPHFNTNYQFNWLTPTWKPKNQSDECVEKFIKFTYKNMCVHTLYVWWISYSLYLALFVLLMARLIYYSYTHDIIHFLESFKWFTHFLCYEILRFQSEKFLLYVYLSNNILHSYTTWYKWLHLHKINLYEIHSW